MSIRCAGLDEMEEVIDVLQVALENAEGNVWAGFASQLRAKRQYWIDGFEEGLKRGSLRVLVAEVCGRIVGVSALHVPCGYGRGCGRFATGVCVLPQYRRRCIGTMLLYESLVALKKSGMRFALVDTLGGIAASRFLYPRFGGMLESLE